MRGSLSGFRRNTCGDEYVIYISVCEEECKNIKKLIQFFMRASRALIVSRITLSSSCFLSSASDFLLPWYLSSSSSFLVLASTVLNWFSSSYNFNGFLSFISFVNYFLIREVSMWSIVRFAFDISCR